MLKNEKLRWLMEKDLNKNFFIPGSEYIYYLFLYFQISACATKEDLYKLKQCRDKYGLVDGIDIFKCQLSIESTDDDIRRKIIIHNENIRQNQRKQELDTYGFIEEDEASNAKLKELQLETDYTPGNVKDSMPAVMYDLYSKIIHKYDYHGTDIKGNPFVVEVSIFNALNGVYMLSLKSTNRPKEDKRIVGFKNHYSDIAKLARDLLRAEITSSQWLNWDNMNTNFGLEQHTKKINPARPIPAQPISHTVCTKKNTRKKKNVDISKIQKAMGLIEDDNGDLDNNIF